MQSNFRRFRLSLTLVFVVTVAAPLGAQPAKNFFEGKAITLLAGSSAGGGTDLTARLIARHMEKYIPGHPSIVVVNKPGAGGSTKHRPPHRQPPGVPPERTKILRDAFAAMTMDEQFLKEAGKLGMEIGLIRGDELNRDVENTLRDKRMMELYRTIASVK
jgi:tripartite-type tricarboxylate transporter receptor subunit TctC